MIIALISLLIILGIWSVAIKCCKKGGGWIALGVVIIITIALPLTGWAMWILGIYLLANGM